MIFQQPSGTVIAEVWGDAKRSISIDVPNGRYIIQRRGWRSSGAYQFRLNKGEVEDVGNGRFHDFPEETLAAKGGYLSVWHNEFTVGYGRIVNYQQLSADRLYTRYGYGASMWSVYLDLDMGTGRLDHTHQSVLKCGSVVPLPMVFVA